MADRRMFSKSIVSSARFLRMPQTSRLLYYDLGMAADDDGIVEAFPVLRMTGAAEDDLRVLASRGFVTILNEDLVSFLQDWHTNNQIRRDRYKPSIYKNLLVQLEHGNQTATIGCQSDNQMATQSSIGQSSIGKGRIIDETARPSTRTDFSPPSVEDVSAYCRERGNKIDPQRFVSYYGARGWKAGTTTIVDWRAVVRSWEGNGRDDKPLDRYTGSDRGASNSSADGWEPIYDA